MKVLAFSAMLALGTGAVLVQERLPQEKPAVEFDRIGPAVGQHVPDFALVDQNGTTRTLRTIIGSKGAMLVFFRSADW